MDNIRAKRKERMGVVLSKNMQKTIVVKVQRLARHSKYDKTIKKFKKFKVHDEKNEANVGDRVIIAETRPISKEKHFRLVQIVK